MDDVSQSHFRPFLHNSLQHIKLHLRATTVVTLTLTVTKGFLIANYFLNWLHFLQEVKCAQDSLNLDRIDSYSIAMVTHQREETESTKEVMEQ